MSGETRHNGMATCTVRTVDGPRSGFTLASDCPVWKRVVWNLMEPDGSGLFHRYVKPRGKTEARYDGTAKGYRAPLAGETEGR